MADVLIIERDEPFSTALEGIISRMGHRVSWARNLDEGFLQLQADHFDVVFINAQLPDGEGVEILSKLHEEPASPEVVILADRGDPDEAERAIKNGAWEYIEKSADLAVVVTSFVRALQYRARKTADKPSADLKTETFQDIVGNSRRMKSCLELLAMAARSDASVLITGETGTGKELFAWAIHNNSTRADRPFVVVDCASLPETLVESTLLGYEKGAFTGAFRDHDGLVKQADGGTLFLDEVSELPLAVQKSFLRVLQERRFRHVGGAKEIESDFRLIAASNRDLDAMVQHRQFRKDLLFRLRGFTIELPPLREHPEDIAALSDYHMAQLCGCYGIKKKGYSPEFFEVLARYNWPGNVRELVNALERAVAAARHEPILFPKHLPTYIRVQLARSSVAPEQESQQAVKGARAPDQSFPRLADVRETAIAHAERRYLKELIAQSKGDVQKACRIAGLSRSRLYALLKKYQISTSVMLSR